MAKKRKVSKQRPARRPPPLPAPARTPVQSAGARGESRQVASTSSVVAPVAPIAADYGYVYRDLRRIAVVATLLLAMLVGFRLLPGRYLQMLFGAG